MEDRETFLWRETTPATPGTGLWNIIIPKGSRHIHWYLMLYKAMGVSQQIIGVLPVTAYCLIMSALYELGSYASNTGTLYAPKLGRQNCL